MAVTLSIGELALQVRVSATRFNSDVPDTYVDILTSSLAAATALVEARAPLAPEDSQNKAVVQIVGYWLDAPTAAPQRFGYSAWQFSGAAQILAPFIERRAQVI